MLPPPPRIAARLLDRVAADGWLTIQKRSSCSGCDSPLTEEEANEPECPHCSRSFAGDVHVVIETIYRRSLAQNRQVDWVIAIHGMNTRGAWQEAFSWHLATTWGKSVPVAVYKYGLIVAGVIMIWRRRKLRQNLRTKLRTLRDEARAQGFKGNPDVIAHSFGTWLFGHLLEKELTRQVSDRLRFGRLILTGCVLRPDFNWAKIKKAELVTDVMNHYGTSDPVVPFAEVTIFDSGPSGRRGFDGKDVINVRAEGFGHSDLFSIDQFVVNGRPFGKPSPTARGITHLAYSYTRYWKPFLTLPPAEFDQLPDRVDPSTRWRPLPWLFRGTLFPILALPLMASILLLGAGLLGVEIWKVRELCQAVTSLTGAALLSVLICIALACVTRWLRR